MAYACHKQQVPAQSLCTDHSDHISDEPHALVMISIPDRKLQTMGFSDNQFVIQEETVAKRSGKQSFLYLSATDKDLEKCSVFSGSSGNVLHDTFLS